MGGKTLLMFDHDDIEEVFFRGFEDKERADFVEKLAELYDSGNLG